MVNPLDAILELFCQSGAMCVLDLSLWQDRLCAAWEFWLSHSEPGWMGRSLRGSVSIWLRRSPIAV